MHRCPLCHSSQPREQTSVLDVGLGRSIRICSRCALLAQPPMLYQDRTPLENIFDIDTMTRAGRLKLTLDQALGLATPRRDTRP